MKKTITLFLSLNFLFSNEINLYYKNTYGNIYRVSLGKENLYQVKNLQVDKKKSQSIEYKFTIDKKKQTGQYFDFEDLNLFNHQFQKTKVSGIIGNGVEFLSKESEIVWKRKTDFYFNNSRDIGEFSIEFYFYPYHFNGKQILLHCLDWVANDKKQLIEQGFSIELRYDFIYINFKNMFYFRDKTKSYQLRSKIEKKEEWKFLRVCLEQQGKLSLFINEVQKDMIFTSSDETAKGTIYLPFLYSKNQAPLKIGSLYSGKMDELYIGKRNETTKESDIFGVNPNNSTFSPISTLVNKYNENPSVYLTQVISLDDWLKIGDIYLEADYFPSYKVEIRDSPIFFPPNSSKKSWRIINHTNLDELKLSQLTTEQKKKDWIRFCQFRISFDNHHRKRTGVLKNLYYYSERYVPPSRPTELSAWKNSSNKAIYCQWLKTTEKNIKGWFILLYNQFGQEIGRYPYSASKENKARYHFYSINGSFEQNIYYVKVGVFSEIDLKDYPVFSEKVLVNGT